jgi:hypothetical protein
MQNRAERVRKSEQGLKTEERKGLGVDEEMSVIGHTTQATTAV